MKKMLALFALAPALALATTTWTVDTTLPTHQAIVAKAVCTTGSESAPADGAATAGISLVGLTDVTIHVEAAAAMTAGGKLQIVLYNSISTKWNLLEEIVVGADQYRAFVWEVTGEATRMAVVPSGIGQASTIYLLGAPRRK